MPQDWFNNTAVVGETSGGETPNTPVVTPRAPMNFFAEPAVTEPTVTEEKPNVEKPNTETSTETTETKDDGEKEAVVQTDEEIEQQLEKPETPQWIKDNRRGAKAYEKIISAIPEEDREVFEPMLPKAVGLAKASIDGTGEEVLTTIGSIAGKARVREIEESILEKRAIEYIAKAADLTPELFKARLNPVKAEAFELDENLTTAFSALDDEDKAKINKIVEQAKRSVQLEAELNALKKDRDNDLTEFTAKESGRLKKAFDTFYNGALNSAAAEMAGATNNLLVESVHSAVHGLLVKDDKMRAFVGKYWNDLKEDEDEEILKPSIVRINKRVREITEEYMRQAKIPFTPEYKELKKQTQTPSRREGNGNAVRNVTNKTTANKKDFNPWDPSLPQTPEVLAAKQAAVRKRSEDLRAAGR